MNFFRLLFLTLAVWLAYRAIKYYLNRPKPPSPAPTLTADMVRCTHCGLHIPKLEALRDGEQFYCGQQHLADNKKTR